MWTDSNDQANGHLLQVLEECAKKCQGMRSSDLEGH